MSDNISDGTGNGEFLTSVDCPDIQLGLLEKYAGAYLEDYPLVTIDTTGITAKKYTGISLNKNCPMTKIMMPCGEEMFFKNIPEKTVMCPCGNPDHIMFEIREE